MIFENVTDELEFLVVHPLDDVQEKKAETKHLAPRACRRQPGYRAPGLAGMFGKV